jgi:hypothetical protein
LTTSRANSTRAGTDPGSPPGLTRNPPRWACEAAPRTMNNEHPPATVPLPDRSGFNVSCVTSRSAGLQLNGNSADYQLARTLVGCTVLVDRLTRCPSEGSEIDPSASRISHAGWFPMMRARSKWLGEASLWRAARLARATRRLTRGMSSSGWLVWGLPPLGTFEGFAARDPGPQRADEAKLLGRTLREDIHLELKLAPS